MAKRDWHLWGFFLLFIISILLKFPLWGILSYGEHHWWSAHSLNFATNWIDEGYFYLRGMLYTQAASVEFAEAASRSVEHLTTSVFVLPIFWIAKILGMQPSMWMVNFLDCVLHAVLAYLSATLAYWILIDFKEKHRRIAFLATAFAVLFSYKVFYLYSVVYWSDHLVLPLIAGILYLEFLIHPKDKSYKLLTYQQLLILAACLVDSYGFIFSLVLFSYFVFHRDLKRSLQVIYPVGLALVLTVFYVAGLGPWALVKGQVLSEIGLRLTKETGVGDLFAGVFLKHLGFYALGFLLSFGLAEYLQRKKILSSKMMLLFFAPPVIYAFVYANKSLSVEFSALKFYFPILIFFFGILPACIVSYVDALPKKKKNEKSLGFALAALPVVLTLVLLAVNYSGFLIENKKDMERVRLLQWIRSLSQPEQVIFSNELTVNFLPPQGTYFLRKPVWRFGGRVGVTTWQRIFHDAVDYPLLWLEVESKNTPHCIQSYLAKGAQKLGGYENIQAFLFGSVKTFASLSNQDLELCLKIPKETAHNGQ